MLLPRHLVVTPGTAAFLSAGGGGEAAPNAPWTRCEVRRLGPEVMALTSLGSQ